MTVRSQMRGHPVWHDGTVWRHADDRTLAPASGGQERPCTHCGLTAEPGYGPDPCLGWGDGPACCGHGQPPTRGDAQGWVVQPPPVADGAGRSPQPVSGSLSPRPPRRRGRRTTAGRPRHPYLVSLGLVTAALVLLAGLFWVGVL